MDHFHQLPLELQNHIYRLVSESKYADVMSEIVWSVQNVVYEDHPIYEGPWNVVVKKHLNSVENQQYINEINRTTKGKFLSDNRPTRLCILWFLG